MCDEISLSSVDFDRFDQGFGKFFEPTAGSDPRFHAVIYSQESENWRFTRDAVPETTTPSELAQRTQKAVRNYVKAITPMDSGASGEVGARWDWGGKDGSEFSAYIKGKAHDDNGNSAEIKIEQKSDGKGSATASVKHEEKSDKK